MLLHPSHRTVDDVVAEVLDVPRADVTDELAFRTIPQWDSLRHVELLLALEEHLGTPIDAELVARLTSVRAIRAFAGQPDAVRALPAASARGDTIDAPPVARGLSGVEVDETQISHIDGDAGRLTYRGIDVGDLVAHSSFEETAYLLLHGELPTLTDLGMFERELLAARGLPEPVRAILRTLRGARPIEALRTGVSALAVFDEAGGSSLEAMVRSGIRLLGQVPMLVAEHHAMRSGRRLRWDPTRSHAGHVLTMLTGRTPTDTEMAAFDRTLILLAEHGASASSFGARVTIGTRSDLHAALTTAIATFAGTLHGGAIEGVAEMIEAVGEPSRAAAWVRDLRNRNEPVLGFGHRLYTTEDPRAAHLREMAETLSEATGDGTALRILEEVREAMRPLTRYGVDVNVDFYAGLVFRLLGIPTDLFTPAFAIARTAGWVAQCLEQRANNVLIRPLLRYTGEPVRPYVPLHARTASDRAPRAIP